MNMEEVTAVDQDLQALLHLQEKHKVVMEVEEALDALRPDIEALDAELQAAASQLEAHRSRVAEADSRRAELEGKIESYRIMQERRRQRLEWVRGAKEASTLMAELDLARSVLAREEAEWLRSADRVQEMERAAAEAEKLVEDVRTAQAPKREEIAGRQSELHERLRAARAEREEAAKAVKPVLYDRFERILQGRARLALFPLQNGACGHCYTAVPLHRQHKLRGGESIEACEACGVLLYHQT
jgi:predicted  nucleic acid-binding Zn-ribbon protein